MSRRLRMKKISKRLVFLFIVVIAGQALAQDKYPLLFNGENPFLFFGRNPLTDLRFLGAGARARGMGGACYAVSDDPPAVTWNPAGLVQMDKAQMPAALHSTRAKNEYSGSYAPGLSFSGSPDQTVDQLAYLCVVVPFELKGRHFVAGASIPNPVSDI